MKKYLVIVTAIALLFGVNGAFAEDSGQKNQADSSGFPKQDARDPQRILNQGNYQEIESGMNPVVIKSIRKDNGAGSGLSQLGAGKLYTAVVDNSTIAYTVGSPVILNPNVYLIWYGSWKIPDTPSVLTNLASYQSPQNLDYTNFTNNLIANLGSSNRWKNIIQNYYFRDSTIKTNIQNLKIAGNFFMRANISIYGSTLSQSSILKIVNSAYPSNDSSGIYIVLTSSDIKVSGFNSGKIQFCGWHSFTGVGANARKYAFVGDPANATYCQGQAAPTPNGNVGADSMASILVHEIEEAVTDPVLNAWWSSSTTGNENADKCAWSWGITSGTSALSNYSWNNTNIVTPLKYLIQQEFKLAMNPTSSTSTKDIFSGSCALS